MTRTFDQFFQPQSISLYLHWPFCLSKCPYCAFNSHPIQSLLDFDSWKRGYVYSLREAAREVSDRSIRSIYFGGGTPSLLPPSFISDLLELIAQLWPVDSRVEITLEMNPGRMTAKKIADFRSVGINRLSIGIQSLTPEGLTVLGRQHSVEESLQTFELAMHHFDNVSVDLMYAWPGHSVSMWKRELSQALTLGAPHLSLYQLVVENDSVFGGMYSRGELILPEDDVCAEMFELTQELTEASRRPAYEISNHAKPGFESLHNIGYWLYRDYLGIGPGAHSRLTLNGNRYALVLEANPHKWLTSILNNEKVLQERAELSETEQTREALLVGLRLREGIDCRSLPVPLESAVEQRALSTLIQEGFLEFDDQVLRATAAGRERLNALTSYLIR